MTINMLSRVKATFQIIHESKTTLVPKMKKFPCGIPEILRSQDWDRQKKQKNKSINTPATAVLHFTMITDTFLHRQAH